MSHFGVLSSWCFVQIVSRLVLKRLCMYILQHIYYMACLSFLIQYIGNTPPNPKSAKMCMKFNFIYIHIYVECLLCIVVYLTTMEPNEFGNHFVLEFLF